MTTPGARWCSPVQVSGLLQWPECSRTWLPPALICRSCCCTPTTTRTPLPSAARSATTSPHSLCLHLRLVRAGRQQPVAGARRLRRQDGHLAGPTTRQCLVSPVRPRSVHAGGTQRPDRAWCCATGHPIRGVRSGPVAGRLRVGRGLARRAYISCVPPPGWHSTGGRLRSLQIAYSVRGWSRRAAEHEYGINRSRWSATDPLAQARNALGEAHPSEDRVHLG